MYHLAHDGDDVMDALVQFGRFDPCHKGQRGDNSFWTSSMVQHGLKSSRRFLRRIRGPDRKLDVASLRITGFQVNL